MGQELEIASKGPYSLGEGPMWDRRTSRLIWIDIEVKRLHYETFEDVEGECRSTEVSTIELSGMPGTVVLTENTNQVIVPQDDGVKRINLTTGEATHLIDFPEGPNMRFNDGKCDPAGRLWVGTMDRDGTAGAGTLYRIDPDLSLHPMLEGITCSNGLVWNSDATRMYYIDSYTCQVRGFDFDVASGTLSNPEIVVQVPEDRGWPDGMTIDTADKIWVAHWCGSCVARYDPLTGETMEVLPIPTERVTACVFGHSSMDTLFITTAKGSNDGGWTDCEKYPLTGALFMSDLEVTGPEAFVFKG